MEALLGAGLTFGANKLFGTPNSGTTNQQNSSYGTQASAPVDLTPEAFANLQPGFASILQNLFQNPGQGVAPPPGNDLTTPNANMSSTLASLQATAGVPGSNPAWNVINQTLQGNFLPGQAGANPFFDAAVESAQRPTRQALEDTLTRTLPGAYTAAGQQIGGGLRSPNANLKPSSTAFDLAAARAYEGGARALGDIATNMGNQAYTTERGLQSQAINQALTAGQQDVQALLTNLEAQSVPLNLKKYGYEEGVKRTNEQINQLLQTLALTGQVTRPVTGQVQTGTQTSQGSTTGVQTGNPLAFLSQLFPKGVGLGTTQIPQLQLPS